MAGLGLHPVLPPMVQGGDCSSQHPMLLGLVAPGGSGLHGNPIFPALPSVKLATDAADTTWRAHIGDMRMQGKSPYTQTSGSYEQPISQVSCSSSSSGASLFSSTNTTAFFYKNNQGGVRSPPLYFEALWFWDQFHREYLNNSLLLFQDPEHPHGPVQHVLCEPRVAPQGGRCPPHLPQVGISPTGPV